MITPTGLSSTDLAEWESLKKEKEAQSTTIRELEAKREAVASRIFSSLLQNGKWKVDASSHYPTLRPADAQAEDAVESILAAVFHLGHSGRGTLVDAEHTSIDFSIHDGEITLRLETGMRTTPENVKKDMKTLGIDVDLRDFALREYKVALDFAERELRSAQDKVKNLKAAIQALRCP